jgi:2-polyprenyl-3-methyl-5-hydroxy-6-metoxy-1,4-benzoquinol methylase
MSHKEKVADFLQNQGINMQVQEFISITSNIYHKYESRIYDERHLSIQLGKPSWNKAIRELNSQFTNQTALNVLDFGCGTGFATEQIINSEFKFKCGHFTCYDLSPDMVKECRTKFGNEKNFSFLSNQEGLQRLIDEKGKFDIIMCNAVMHHILEIEMIFPILISLLNPNGIIIIGHDPNNRFYNNKILTSVTGIYRFLKRLNMGIKSKFNLEERTNPEKDVALLTYNELLHLNLIDKSFNIKLITKLIDIHVPISSFKKQPWGEIGFSDFFFEKASSNKLQLFKQFSYNHIKDENAYRSSFWSFVSSIISKIFPDDGSDAIFLLKQKT